ncbi:MAG: holo-ACP synthase [bacterium]|nr:holo-ACP synthase [bacterium]
MEKILGIGVDLAEVGRFRKMPFKRHSDFYKKIFTASEIKYCLSKENPYPHFAARFAAKEAVLKCIQGTIYKILDVEIFNDKNGAPSVKVKKQRGRFLVSLSHTKDHAIATAIWLN